MIKDINLHYRTAQEIKRFQEERLKETLDFVARHSKFYKKLFS